LFQTIIFAYVFIPIITIFSKKDISQGSVATQLWCGGTFDNRVTANFPQNV